jgi:transposase InsO family protein
VRLLGGYREQPDGHRATRQLSDHAALRPPKTSRTAPSTAPGSQTVASRTAHSAPPCSLGVQQFRTAARSPWENGFAERWIGTLRRELLDHVIVLGERHLLRLVRQHVGYYNEDRPHMSLRGDAPIARPVEPPNTGDVVALPRVGGLHHRYSRAA